MWNHCGQVSPAHDFCGPTQSMPVFDHCAPTQVMPAYDMCGGNGGHRGSWFVLIVVLFILLIIVGKSYL